MATADNSTDLKRDNTLDGVNASINTLAPTSPTTTGYTDADFSNCISTNTNCINKWGYKNGLSSNYFPFVSGATILENTAATNGDNTTLRFAAKIDYNQPSGTYNNELIFTATANPITYNINYYNGYDTSSTGIIGKQDSSTGTTSYVNLAPKDPTTGSPITTPTRATYTFTGWCIDDTNRTNVSVNTTTQAVFNSTNTKVTAYNNPATVCNGTMYQINDPMPLSPNDSNNINLYAVWTPTTVAQAYNTTAMTMQNMSPSICAAITPNQWGIVTDARDNQQYHIAKLEDNRCWMLDNLDLDAYAYRNSFSSANTHINTSVETAVLTSFRSGNRSAGDNYATGGVGSENSTNGYWDTYYSYSVPLINRSTPTTDKSKCDSSINSSYPCVAAPSGVTEGYQNNYYYHTTVLSKFCLKADGAICDATDVADTYYTYGVGDYQTGSFYNFCAASLGSYCYGNGSTGSGYPASGNATNADVCPKNWRLPSGDDTTGEFQILADTLSNNYGSTVYNDATSPFSLQTMLSTPVSGYYRGGAGGRQGTYGIFWSSTNYNDTYMYYMWIKGVGINPHNKNTRHFGLSVRCIAQN